MEAITDLGPAGGRIIGRRRVVAALEPPSADAMMFDGRFLCHAATDDSDGCGPQP